MAIDFGFTLPGDVALRSSLGSDSSFADFTATEVAPLATGTVYPFRPADYYNGRDGNIFLSSNALLADSLLRLIITLHLNVDLSSQY